MCKLCVNYGKDYYQATRLLFIQHVQTITKLHGCCLYSTLRLLRPPTTIPVFCFGLIPLQKSQRPDTLPQKLKCVKRNRQLVLNAQQFDINIEEDDNETMDICSPEDKPAIGYLSLVVIVQRIDCGRELKN